MACEMAQAITSVSSLQSLTLSDTHYPFSPNPQFIQTSGC